MKYLLRRPCLRTRNIIEPALTDAGRKPVAGNPLVTARIEEIPQEISLTHDDLKLAPSDKMGYKVKICDYIKKHNPAVDTASVEFKALAGIFTNQLFNNNGRLSEADFNYNAGHYNSCRLISGYIEATRLPALFKEGLRKYYSELIIREGNEKNAGDEMNWLNWIPSGGVVVIVTDEALYKGQKGVVCTKRTSLPDIIKVVYPQFDRFSEEAKDRALIFISRMNPDIHVRYSAWSDSGESQMRPGTASYIVEKGVPVLIPEYKFISE